MALILVVIVGVIYLFARSAEPLDLAVGMDDAIDGIVIMEPVKDDDGWRLFIQKSDDDGLLISFLKKRFRSVLPRSLGVYYQVNEDAVCYTVALNPNRFAPLYRVVALPSYLKMALPNLEESYTARSGKDLVVVGNCKMSALHVFENIRGSSEKPPVTVEPSDTAEIHFTFRNNRGLLLKDCYIQDFFGSLTGPEIREIESVTGSIDLIDQDRYRGTLSVHCKHPLASRLLLPRLRKVLNARIDRVKELRGADIRTVWEVDGKTILLNFRGDSLREIL